MIEKVNGVIQTVGETFHQNLVCGENEAFLDASQKEGFLATTQIAAVNEVALSVVDQASMAAAQQNCEDIGARRAGHHPAKLNLKDHEHSPGIHLYFDVSDDKKASGPWSQNHIEPS